MDFLKMLFVVFVVSCSIVAGMLVGSFFLNWSHNLLISGLALSVTTISSAVYFGWLLRRFL